MLTESRSLHFTHPIANVGLFQTCASSRLLPRLSLLFFSSPLSLPGGYEGSTVCRLVPISIPVDINAIYRIILKRLEILVISPVLQLDILIPETVTYPRSVECSQRLCWSILTRIIPKCFEILIIPSILQLDTLIPKATVTYPRSVECSQRLCRSILTRIHRTILKCLEILVIQSCTWMFSFQSLIPDQPNVPHVYAGQY